MPQLLIQGLLLDKDGKPITNKPIIIVLSDFYGRKMTYEALNSGKFDQEGHHYNFEKVQTGENGEFICRLPGESRYIGFMPPLMNPSEETLKEFVFGIRTNNGEIAVIEVSGTSAKVHIPVGNEFELEPLPDDYPLDISPAINRSKTIDIIQLLIKERM